MGSFFKVVSKFAGFAAEKEGTKALSAIPEEAAAFIKSLDEAEKVTEEVGKAPRYAFRTRDIGEEGIPLSRMPSATMSEQELQRLSPGRAAIQKKSQELIRINLENLPSSAYEIVERGNQPAWVRFKRMVHEDELERIGLGAQLNVDSRLSTMMMKAGEGNDNSTLLNRSMLGGGKGSRKTNSSL